MPVTSASWLEDEGATAAWSFWNPGTGAAVKSFWLGCSGLAVLAHVVALASVYLGKVVFDWVGNNFYDTLGGMVLWHCMRVLEQTISGCFVPSVILVAALPILAWRGSFGWRSLIALTLIVSAIGLMADSLGYLPRPGKLADEALELLALAGCWIALPAISLCPPFSRLWKLRLLAGVGIYALLGCILLVGLDHIYDGMVVSWLILFSTAIAGTLFFRNAGKLATLEATATQADIQPLSAATLMELTVLSGALCAAVMYWTSSVDPQRYLVLFCTALAIGIVVPSSCGLSLAGWWRGGNCRWALLLSWLTCGFCFGIASLFLNAWHYNLQWQLLLEPAITATACCGGMLVSLALHLYGMLCIRWLIYCGWSLPAVAADRAARSPGELRTK